MKTLFISLTTAFFTTQANAQAQEYDLAPNSVLDEAVINLPEGVIQPEACANTVGKALDIFVSNNFEPEIQDDVRDTFTDGYRKFLLEMGDRAKAFERAAIGENLYDYLGAYCKNADGLVKRPPLPILGPDESWT